MGRVFACGAFVRSGRLQTESEETNELIVKVCEEVLQLGQKKSFLMEPAVTVLLDMAERVRKGNGCIHEYIQIHVHTHIHMYAYIYI